MLEVDNASYDKSNHEVGASRLKFFLWYFTNALFFINPLNPFSFLKIRLLRIFGAKVDKGVLIKPGVSIKYPWKLEIGRNSWIGENVWIDNIVYVKIGANVCISQGAYLLTGNHNYKKTTFDLIVKGITLENGVWIGAKSIVNPGVICESHSVLAVNSVAATNLEPFKIYQGNPAMFKRMRKIQQ